MKRIMILSIALLVIGNIVHGQSAKLLSNAAQDFLNTLSTDELKITTYQLEDTLRTNWTNLPVGMAERPGIRYGDLSEKSKIQFQEILTTIFSSQGYLKTNNIMHLDDYIIRIYEIAIENKLMEPETMKELQALNWGHGNYYVSIYGNPGEQSNWGLKFEGHHLSINLTIIDGNISITPLFLGSDPALVRTTQFAGIRALSKEEDYGIELINLLNEQQKSIAIISDEFPMDIITSPEGPQRLTEYQGIKGEALNEKQKSQLKHLINE